MAKEVEVDPRSGLNPFFRGSYFLLLIPPPSEPSVLIRVRHGGRRGCVSHADLRAGVVGSDSPACSSTECRVVPAARGRDRATAK